MAEKVRLISLIPSIDQDPLSVTDRKTIPAQKDGIFLILMMSDRAVLLSSFSFVLFAEYKKIFACVC